jgi:hypothetical protein
MANTLNDLIPDLYASLDVVSRELVGMIPSVTVDGSVNRASKDQSVRVAIAPANVAGFDVTPAMSIPAAADQVIGNAEIVINKVRGYPFSWNGNEQNGLNSGAGYDYIRRNQMTQAMRALVNEMESDLCGLHTTFSRAHGGAGTTPFGTAGNFTDATLVHKILKDNGSPSFDNNLVINTTAGANLGGFQSNSSVEFSEEFLRQGVFRTLNGLNVRESGQVKTFTAGSFTSGTLTSAVRAAGTTSLVTTADYSAGLGAGDIITLAHESGAHKYVVQSVSAGAIVIAAPGLINATAASGTVAITKVATSARNLAFNRSAIVLATRMPERPQEGDLALDVATIVDERSGIAFEVAIYPGNRMVRYEISAAWGVKNIKPEHTALLLG